MDKQLRINRRPGHLWSKMYLFLEIPLFLLIILYSYLEAFVKLFISAKRKSVAGEIVLITGAGHGLGRATAYEFAKHHCQLVLWDINKVGSCQYEGGSLTS